MPADGAPAADTCRWGQSRPPNRQLRRLTGLQWPGSSALRSSANTCELIWQTHSFRVLPMPMPLQHSKAARLDESRQTGHQRMLHLPSPPPVSPRMPGNSSCAQPSAAKGWGQRHESQSPLAISLPTSLLQPTGAGRVKAGLLKAIKALQPGVRKVASLLQHRCNLQVTLSCGWCLHCCCSVPRTASR